MESRVRRSRFPTRSSTIPGDIQEDGHGAVDVFEKQAMNSHAAGMREPVACTAMGRGEQEPEPPRAGSLLLEIWLVFLAHAALALLVVRILHASGIH